MGSLLAKRDQGMPHARNVRVTPQRRTRAMSRYPCLHHPTAEAVVLHDLRVAVVLPGYWRRQVAEALLERQNLTVAVVLRQKLT